MPSAFLGPPIAHRGLHDRRGGRIENSRAAVAAAVAAGYGVEIDVQASADGEAMVFHDSGLSRLTDESGPLCERRADDLGRIGLKGADETIPTLSEILAVVGGRVALLIEVKDQGGRLDDTGVGPLEARVAALLTGYHGPVALMSFNPASVAACATTAAGVPRGLVACSASGFEGVGLTRARRAALAALADYAAVGASFVSYSHRALPTPETARLRAGGAPVLCWTVRSAAQEAAARRHADNVTFEGYPAAIRG
ncbi:MAG: phosphodiesterase [Rhodobacteraceae bacterium]|nr:MAG: phosphodiesterase [Paracoccaceae bacterium]